LAAVKTLTFIIDNSKLWRYELTYKLHLKVRKFHDVLVVKSPVYKKVTENPAARPVKNATVSAFFVSLFIFLTVQYILPQFNLFTPTKVQAGSDTVQWTTNGDLAYNKAGKEKSADATLCAGTTRSSSISLAGTAYTDATCAAAAADSGASLASSISVDKRTISGSYGYGVASNLVTNKMYVTNGLQSGNGAVAVRDITNNETLIRTISVGNLPMSVAVNSVTNRIYVINADGVSVLDGANNDAVLRTITVGTSPKSVAVNTVTNRIYVTNNGGGTVSVLDGNSNDAVVRTITVGSAPWGVAVNTATNRIYVANYSTSTISVLDGANNDAVLRTINVGTNPTNVAVNATTNLIYVAKPFDPSVKVLNGANSDAVLRTITGWNVGQGPTSLTVNEVKNYLYVDSRGGFKIMNEANSDAIVATYSGVTTGDGYLVEYNSTADRIYLTDTVNGFQVLDGKNNILSGTTTVGTSPNMVAVNPTTNRIYVSNYTSSTVSVLDGNNGDTVLRTISVGANARGIAVNSVTNRIYVAVGISGVKVLDGNNSDVVLRSLSVSGTVAQGVAVNEVTNKIYVTETGFGRLNVFDGANSDAYITNIGLTSLGIGVAVNSVTNKIYATSGSGNSTYVIDGSNDTLLRTITVGNAPQGVAINTSTNRIYVANNTDGTVSVLNGANSDAVLQTVAGVTGAKFVGVNSSTNKIYVSNYNSPSNVYVYKEVGVTASLIANIVTDAYSSGVAVNATTNKIYVANGGTSGTGSTVSVINKVAFSSSGTISGLKMAAGANQKINWSSLAWTATTPANTSVKFNIRTSDDNSSWSSWSADLTNSAGSSITASASRYIDVQATLATTDGLYTPTLSDVTLSYDTIEAPVNANTTIYRSDGTTKLKDYTGADVNAGVSPTGGAWTNESSAKITTTGLTCTGCGTFTGPYIEVEAKPVGSAFTGTTNLYTGAVDGGNASTTTLTNLTAGTGYHLQVRAHDAQGRVSGWTSYGTNAESDADITVEQTAPTGTVTINSSAQYAGSTSVTLTNSATDSGGSNLAQMQFSNDGTTWSGWETYNASKAWTLTSGDGAKTVYAQYKDWAGNVSGWVQDNNADFNAGLTKTNTNIANGSIQISPPPVDPYAADYVNGRAGTAMEGKQVYKADSTAAAWGPASSCTGPQCSTGLDTINAWEYALVSDSSVDFSSYPAQNACKAIGGRLPYEQELLELYAGQATYGGFVAGTYWSAIEADSTRTWGNYFADGSWTLNGKTGSIRFRCVRATPPSNNYLDSATFESSIKNFTSSALNIHKVTFTTSVPSGTTITVTTRAGNTATPDGTWTTYQTLTSGATIPSNSVLNGKQYLQYKVEMTGGTNTPTFSDIIFESSATANITLDTVPPANVANLKAYTDSGKGTEITNDTWHNVVAPYFEWTANGDSDLAGYKYCFSTSIACTPDTYPTPTNTTNHYAVSPNMSVEGTHYFRVVAVDNAGQVSVAPTAFTYKLDTSVPTPVTGLSATKTDINKIRVTWNPYTDPASPVENYKLERVKDTGNQYQIGDNWTAGDAYAVFTLTDNTPFDDTPGVVVQGQTAIDASTQYQYRISVKDTANSGYSSYQVTKVYGMTDDLRSPDPVSVVGSAACDGTLNNVPSTSIPMCSDVSRKGFEITVVWSPGSDSGSGIAGYNVYRSSTGVLSSYELVGTTSDIVNFYHDNDTTNIDDAKKLNDFTTYYYRITAFDASSHANESDILAISNPTINATSASTPDVTAPGWFDGSGNATTNANLVATPMGIDPNPPISLPEDPVTVPQDPIYHQRIHLTWDGATDYKARSKDIVPGTITYTIYQSLTSGGTYSQIATTTSLEYDVDQLQEFTNYFYKVTAKDASADHNTSGQSDYGTAMTASNSVPVVPTNVTVTTKKGNPTDTTVGDQATITYKGSYAKNCLNGIRCITKYEVYRATSNWTNSVLVNENYVNNLHDDRDTTYTFVDNGLENATTYYYKVRALDNTPANPDGGPFVSGLSGISVGTIGAGWDTTPDVNAPTIPAGGLDVRVRDTHPNEVELRNIVTWKVLTSATVPRRNGNPDFAKYIVRRETRNPDTDALISDDIVSEISDMSLNYYMDVIQIAFADLKYRYYVQIQDNAGTDYKYSGTQTIINAYSNLSTNEYSTDSIVPSKSTPKLVGTVSVDNVGVASATISWNTDQDSDAVVEFREKYLRDGNGNFTTNLNTTGSFTVIGANTSPVENNTTQAHIVNLFGLKPNVTYDYRVVSKNYLGNTLTVTGTDVPALTTAGFNITPGSVTTTTSTAEISWTTNLDAASAFVEYQLQKQPGDEAQGGTAGVEPSVIETSPRDHRVVIKGLRSNRTYTYKIKSISKDGYLSEYPAGSFSNFKTRNFDSAQFSLAPASSNVADRNITSTTAQIVWQTATETTSWVDYGTASGIYGISSGDDNMATTHVVNIEGLVPGTKYFYHVRVKDSNEVEYTSQEYSFTAVLKPKISNMTVKNVTPYAITIAWDTNVDTETIINWGTTPNYGEKRGKSGVSKVHELTIDNLLDNQEYHYQILAKDDAGNEVADTDKIVRTPLDTEGPKITNVKIDVLPMGESDTTSSVIVSWTTNKPASTLVEYDEGVIGGTYGKRSVEDLSLNNSHTVIIKGLTPASSYHYRLVSADKRNNRTVSQDYTFVTPSKEKSILQLILKSLEETFAWTRNLNQFFGNIGKRLTGK